VKIFNDKQSRLGHLLALYCHDCAFVARCPNSAIAARARKVVKEPDTPPIRAAKARVPP